MDQDIDGEPRDLAHPDIGAAEFTPPSHVTTPYAGDYTVGTGADFGSLGQAIDSLLLKGISDEVRLNFLNGTHITHVSIPAIPGTGPDKNLILQSQSGNPEDVLIKYEEQSDTENGYVINCHGTDFMKVRNLSFKADKQEGLFSIYARVFKFFGGTENLSFTGNHLESVYDENNRPHLSIFFSNDMVHYYDSLVIADNEMENCAVGIYFQNYGYYQDQNKPIKLHILNNELSHVGYNGFHFQNHNGPTIKNNVIDSESRGMFLNNCINNTTITGNQVSARIYYAIGVDHCPAVNSLRGLVANNFITITGTYDAQGINMLHSENYDIVYNSVHVTSDHIDSRAIHASNGEGLVVLNNIFTNMGGGYAAKYYGGLSAIDSMDFNDYYTSGSDLALWESTVCPDLSALQSASGMDQHSLSVDPGFVSDIDLHLNSPAVTEHATPIPFVTIDIDGEERDASHPDMGADEFEVITNLPPELVDSIPDLTIDEDSDTTAIARLDTIFADPNPADKLNYTAVSDTSSVDVFVIDTVLNVKPDTNFFGMAEIIVTATDPSGETASDTFILTVTNVQDVPVAVDDTVETDQNTVVIIEVLSNDVDVDGDSLTITHVTQGMNGSASVLPGDSLIEYTPNQNFIGRDTLHYGISDGKNGYDTAAIYVLVARIPLFEEIIINLDSVAFGNAVWGDYDDDGDLDILITGEKQGGVNIYSVYENQDGAFKKASINFGADDYGVRCNNDRSISWFDLNSDNRLEFILTGETNGNEYITEIFDPLMERNIITDLPGVFNGSVDWGDYDNDGDPDLLITGETAGSSQITEIYRNDGEKQVYGDQVHWKFTPVSNELPDLKSSQGVWADLDNDQDLDIILSGMDESGNLVKYVYWNENGEFSTHGPLAYGQTEGSIAPCDYDGDGDLDILFTGDIVVSGYVPQTYLLENEGGTFSEVETPIEGVLFSSSDWGDYDNDGDFDLVICGKDENLTSITHVYTNDNGTFSKADFGLPGIAEGTVRWGDYDNDGDLDILLSGYKSDEPNRFTAIYRNNINEKNTLPAAPENFSVATSDSTATLSWSRATDGESDSLLLTYNLELMQRTQENRVISPLAHENGYRKVVRTGNNSSNTSRTFINLNPGTYYKARLQTIDAAYAGSEFTEIMFHTSSDYFIEDSTILTEFSIESIEFADYDKDGDLDLIAVNGLKDSLMIYPNSDGVISNNPILLGESSRRGIERLNDYDNDNDVDVLLTEIGNEQAVAIYTNQDGSFTSTELDVSGIDFCEAAWGDFDNDGDEDLIISGRGEGYEPVCKLYRNNNGSFEDYSHLITGVVSGDIHFVDYDMDGDMDLFMCGRVPNGDLYHFKLYRNMGGAFDSEYPDIITYGHSSSMDFGDFDNDGDPDLLICGKSTEGTLTSIYQNDNNEFVLYDSTFTPLFQGDCKWADFNNDGLLDIIVSGTTNDGFITEIYYNIEGAFSKVIEFDGFPASHIALGDYNNDQKLDFMVAGRGSKGDINGLLYKNVTSSANLAPDPPEIHSAVAEANSLTFSWTQATDNETPRNGLSYNLRVGTTPGGSEIVSPLSLENGTRQVVNMGNTGQNTTWKIHGLDTTINYYYSVQTIDNGYLASEFTSEKVFVFEPNSIDKIVTGINIYPNPTSGLLYVEMKENHNIRELEVINSMGSVVIQMEVQQSSTVIDLTGHPDGMYVIRSRGGGKVIMSKIMKY
ncbi:MAG: FG-GAP-like repeat-containing protein [Bacteroidota bacterium]